MSGVSFPSYQVLSFSKELSAIFPLIFARFLFVFQVINGDLRPGCRVIVGNGLPFLPE
jgi:hypothetical protein